MGLSPSFVELRVICVKGNLLKQQMLLKKALEVAKLRR